MFRIISLLIILTLFGCTTNHHLTRLGIYRQVSAKEYEELLKNGNNNIIDVRTQSEYRKSHIDGAVNASYLSGHFSKLVFGQHLDNTKPTFIYCETQHRSPLAANELYKMGFKNIIDLDKGMMYWRKKNFPYLKQLVEKRSK